MNHIIPLVFLFTACASSLDDPSISSGIYDLSVSSQKDECDSYMPMDMTKEYTDQAVAFSGGLINVALPSRSSIMERVLLDQGLGYSRTWKVAHPTCPGLSIDKSWSFLESTRGSLSFEGSEMWSHDLECQPLPQSCESQIEAKFQAREVCPKGCELRIGAGLPECSC